MVINAGNNELKTESAKEFVYEVNTAAEKLKKLAESTPVTLIAPPIQAEVPILAGRSEFLRDTLSKVETIKVVGLEMVELDETQHPTESGTLHIIDQINSARKESVILQDCRDDVTIPAKYSQVQPVFKAGCRGCNSLEYTPSLCETCKQLAEAVDTTPLMTIIEKRMNEAYPAVETETHEVKDKNKRSADNHDGGTSSKVTKTD